MNEINIIFEKNNNRSAAYENNNLIGLCAYVINDDKWIINHTEVNSNYKGQGIARKLLQSVIDNARIFKVKIIPECSYAAKVMKDNPEFADILI